MTNRERLYLEACTINRWSSLRPQLAVAVAGLGLSILAYGVFSIVGIL
jgi:hypothetical protein